MPTPPTELWTIGLCVAVVYGISIGSFLNVVIYRLPRGQSVASPTWSYCPSCEHRLGGADLVPLFSFLALGRKCRYCRSPISWRYFGVELLTGVLFALVFLHDGASVGLLFDIIFVSLLVPILFIDLEQFIIPDELSVLGVVVGIAHGIYDIVNGLPNAWTRVIGTDWHLPSSIFAAIICALIFHMISFAGLIYYSASSKAGAARLASSVGQFWLGVLDDYAYLALRFLGFGFWLQGAKRFIEAHDGALEESMERDADLADSGSSGLTVTKTREEIASDIENDEEQTGMGQGDAKLAAMIGANLLLPLSLLSFFAAVMAGSIVGIGMMVRQGRAGRTAIPFGPFMVVGAVVSLLVGWPVIHWYLALMVPASHAAH